MTGNRIKALNGASDVKKARQVSLVCHNGFYRSHETRSKNAFLKMMRVDEDLKGEKRDLCDRVESTTRIKMLLAEKKSDRRMLQRLENRRDKCSCRLIDSGERSIIMNGERVMTEDQMDDPFDLTVGK